MKGYLKPNFLIVGAMKSGTTGIYDDLAEHPDSFLPKHKEPDILHKAKSSAEVLALYSKHFAGAPPNRILGEASTMYTMTPWYEDVSSIAFDALGKDTKIVYIMRDPVDRIISHLAHDYVSGRIKSNDFDRLVFEEERYLCISNYAAQIKPWVDKFGKNNVLGIKFEDYVKSRREVTRVIANFVGLDPELLKERTEISNRKGAAGFVKNPSVKYLIKSNVYRHYLYPLIPDKLLLLLHSMFVKKNPTPKVDLSEETKNKINKELKSRAKELKKFGIGEF